MSNPNPDLIINTLEEILAWCQATASILIPGEGGERPFRGRLSEAFLEKLMGWPPTSILSGERFDLTLLNSDGQPVVNVETKEPGHTTGESEYKAFFARLRRHGTLRFAFITNGTRWERYELLRSLTDQEEITDSDFEETSHPAPSALFSDFQKKPKLGKRLDLILHRARPEDVAEFFRPLLASTYHDLTQPLPVGLRRHQLTKEHPEIIEDFGAVLRDRIDEFRALLITLFNKFRSSELGAEAANVSASSFQLWCERSYVPPPASVLRALEAALADRETSPADLLGLLTRDFGFPQEQSAAVVEALLADKRKKKSTAARKIELLWPLYVQAIERYATQTAHVSVARLLLYRIGEDQGVFERKLSGDTLQQLLAPRREDSPIVPQRTPLVLTEIESVRTAMADFAPTVYESGEFDWWRVVHPELLNASQLNRLQPFEEDIAVAYTRLLRKLSYYDLSSINLDIWRDIYQHFLPEEERQRLGGFYTPQVLVDLALDYAEYRPSMPRLCEKLLIDLASGSGAFVVGALQRLLEHLADPALPCHKSLHARDVPDWERARASLDRAVANIYAIDLHPFAAFLTYINFLFVVLPLYVVALRHTRNLRLAVSIFSANSLLTPGENGPQRELEIAVNSRIQLGRFALERYRELANKKFDFVVGNPPWGGILKGKLAPIFDDSYKKQLLAQYPDTYTGKLDIYSLFYDRALSFLRVGGIVSLVTQGSFIDKEWAGPHVEFNHGDRLERMGLRRKLAEQASLRFLIDLNPFGQLFFGAMNIPCISVFEKRPARESENAVVLLSSKKSWLKGMPPTDRRREVVETVRRCLELVRKSGEPLKQDFATCFAFPLERLRQFGGSRWLLSPRHFTIRSRSDWPQLAQLLEPYQGVTVGGEGGLSIFLMSQERAKQLNLEKELVHKIVKGQETRRWRVQWKGNVILYPYVRNKKGKWQPAFSCHHPPVLDALEFDHPADKFEKDWIQKYGRHPVSLKRLLEHRRDALNIVKFPHAAEYLMQFYEQLAKRIFKKRNIYDFGRQWYEFIWPRDADVILGQPKIISPRLTPKVRFALDEEGMGVQDSCICLAVSENTRAEFDDFRKRLSKIAGRELKEISIYRFLLGVLNSSYSQDLLTTGRRPTPKGHYQIDERFVMELSVPLPKARREINSLFDAVEACLLARSEKTLSTSETKLDQIVESLYAAKS